MCVCVWIVITLWYVDTIKYYVQESRKNAEDLWVPCVAHSSDLSPAFIVFEVFCTLACRKCLWWKWLMSREMQVWCQVQFIIMWWVLTSFVGMLSSLQHFRLPVYVWYFELYEVAVLKISYWFHLWLIIKIKSFISIHFIIAWVSWFYPLKNCPLTIPPK